MLLKCNYCDPIVKRGQKPIKTIDTEIDDYIKDEKKRYYHTECYKLYLKTKKKMTDSEIDKIILERKFIMKLEMKEILARDKFLKWIMDYYNSSLPSYFLKKINEVRNGVYKGLNEPIDYETLLDIYTYMAKYLNKIASQKRIENITNRMNYDLAVVIGNYGEYKRFKEKQMLLEINKSEIEENITRSKMIKLPKRANDEDNFSLSDIIDDLLL